MSAKHLRNSVILFLSMVALACVSQPLSKKNGTGPMIHFERTTHTFTPVFEGEELSHTFIVFNRGTADLDLKKVTHS